MQIMHYFPLGKLHDLPEKWYIARIEASKNIYE